MLLRNYVYSTISWTTVRLRTAPSSIVISIIVKRETNHAVVNVIKCFFVAILDQHFSRLRPKIPLGGWKRANWVFIESARISIGLDCLKISKDFFLRLDIPVWIEKLDFVETTAIQGERVAGFLRSALDSIDVFFGNSCAEHDIFVLKRLFITILSILKIIFSVKYKSRFLRHINRKAHIHRIRQIFQALIFDPFWFPRNSCARQPSCQEISFWAWLSFHVENIGLQKMVFQCQVEFRGCPGDLGCSLELVRTVWWHLKM